MFRRILLIAFLFGTQNGFTQDLGIIQKGFTIGVQVDRSMYQTTDKLKTQFQGGGHIGFLYKIPFDYHVFFVPQADLNYRRFLLKEKTVGEYYRIQEYQLRVAPLLEIDFKNPGENTIFIQFGPSIGYGITGKQTTYYTSGNLILEEKSTLKYGYQSYGRYDANAHLAAGFETASGFRFLAEYVYGLSNMINAEMGARLKYRSFALEAGILLGKKKNK
jgi:hypothetical protein